MKTKTRLMSVAIGFMLILALLITGVYALDKAEVNLGGDLTFEASGVYAKVTGEVVGSKTDPAKREVTFDRDSFADPVSWNDDLEFKADGSQITYTITIENLANDRPLYASVTDTVGEIYNVVKTISLDGEAYAQNLIILPESTGDGTSIATVVVTLKIDNINLSLNEGTTYGYLVKLNDESFETNPENVQDLETTEKLAYVLDDATMTASVKMIDTEKTTGDIVVPTYIKSGDKYYTVTSVAESAFENNTAITSISLPDTIKLINKKAFAGVNTSIFTEYENGYYLGNQNNPYLILIDTTTKDITSFSINESCKVLGWKALYQTKITSIDIPRGVKTLGLQAFTSCSYLASVNIPDSVTLMDSAVFGYCTSLKEVVIPDSVTEIGVQPFYGCSALVTAKLSENLDCLPQGCFYDCAKLESVTIPKNVKVINEYSFSGCKSLKNIALNENITSIGMAAFQYCENLCSDIIIPRGVTVINDYAFNGCSSLTTVVLHDKITSIGRTAFQYCENLCSDIIIPRGVTVINDYAFNGCSSLTTIVLHDKITSIGRTAFQNCKNLSSEIVIPSDVIKINDYTFNGCSSLTTVVMHDNITYIGRSAFNGCKNAVINKIPSGAKEIGFVAFQGCFKLQDVTLPSSLEYIGDYALNHCYNAQNTTITIPASIKQIGGVSYDPENPDLDVIGTHVFYDCATTTLTEFVMGGENENFTVVDGVLYRKDAEGNPSVIVAYPPAKTDEKYEMPNTVVDGFELGLSRPFNLREIVLSDNFVIYKNEAENLNNNTWGNNLAIMLYLYTGVTKISVRDTNTKYMEYNGAIYSKDGTTLYYAPMLSGLQKDSTETATLNIKDGTTTIFFGALGEDGAYTGNYAPENNLDEANHLKIYDKIYIPASVTSIDATTLANINLCAWSSSNTKGWIIEVDENNANYQVTTSTDENGAITGYTLVAKA